MMEKLCACKGKRSCLLCETVSERKSRDLLGELRELESYVYCPSCKTLFKGWHIVNDCNEHATLERENAQFHKLEGIVIEKNFLTSTEARELVEGIDSSTWDLSQSGRRKKNFGPKVNFKKRKICVDTFSGFFNFSQFVRKRLTKVQELKNFQVIEECFLEYDARRGSHIEPHIDDCYIWGERIVTVNCVGDSVLNLTKHIPMYPKQYNIDCVNEYKNDLAGHLIDSIPDNILIRIPMPALSLLVLYGPPRYQFEHSVLREDISDRRVCIAYREFTKPYLHLNKHFEEN